MGMVQPMRPAAQPVRDISIQGLLHWAFAVEYAQVDFEDAMADAQPASFGMEYVLIERGKLGGIRIDGGGRSASHDDADMVASAVAILSDLLGGRRMALRIAELARAGRSEDWMQDARPRCEPREWGKSNQFGCKAKTEVVARREYQDRGRTRAVDVLWCPVVYRDTASEIAAARRRYLAWRSALMEIRFDLQHRFQLSTWRLTDELPPVAPWRG